MNRKTLAPVLATAAGTVLGIATMEATERVHIGVLVGWGIMLFAAFLIVAFPRDDRN